MLPGILCAHDERATKNCRGAGKAVDAAQGQCSGAAFGQPACARHDAGDQSVGVGTNIEGKRMAATVDCARQRQALVGAGSTNHRVSRQCDRTAPDRF